LITLVTGGAGFLGSHLVDALIARGDTVIIIDNLSTGNVSNLERSISLGKATFVYADVAVDAATLRETIEKATSGRIERIFHLASPASPEAYGAHPWETLGTNGIGTMSLIELAEKHGARFIFASTSEIYGDPLVHPQPEDYFGNVNPIGPRSCYDEGKRFGEAAVAAAMAARGLDARIVRFFNCYGPRMQLGDGRLVPALMSAVLAKQPLPIQGTGQQTRSMTYVHDAIELLLLVSERSFDKLQPVNVGNDDERSVLLISEAFAKVANVPFEPVYMPARAEDPQRRCPDLTVARSIGWSPTTSLEDGLRETYAWFTKERLLYA